MYAFYVATPLKVKKPTELRENLFETLEQSSRGQVFLIQHKGGNSILQDESGYLDLLEQVETLKSVNRGLQDYLDGKTLSHAEMRLHLQRHAKKTNK
jgi:hypothetical protein